MAGRHDHRVGHRRGSGGAPRAGARLPAANDPAGADAAPPRRRPAALPRRPVGRDRCGRRCRQRGAGRRRRWLRRLRVDRRLPRGPAAPGALRGPRGQHQGRAGQPAGCPLHAVRRDDVRRHPASTRSAHRAAVAARDQHARPRRPAAGRTGRVRAAPGPDDPARDRRLARCPTAQPDLRGLRARPARGRGAGAPPGRARQRLRPTSRPGGRPGVRRAGVLRRHGRGL